ncbi:MAG: DUF58 domain-containing protein [Rhodospirillaceae bacterium TMED8]|nr:DUF58 domain-containing protein [Magnetovibrio sp.]OUT48151.1 MAG: DUF58 domain-containing protein [Rhodospirillaceae bacterium TMED8]
MLENDKLDRSVIDMYHQAETLGAGLPPLIIAAERLAATVSQGVHGRRRIGQGETFWQFRRYEHGDSMRQIDWRRSARSDPLYVRESEWEAAQSVWLWRDSSPSMGFASTPKLERKVDRATLLLLALAWLLVRGGERVSLLGADMSPASGRGEMLRLYSHLQKDKLPSTSVPSIEPLPRYSRLLLIGDFLGPLDDISQVIEAYRSRGVRGHLLQILDPAEGSLPYEGRALFEGFESEGEVLIPNVGSLRQNYRRELERHCNGLKSLAQGSGWSFANHYTDNSPSTALMAFYLQFSQSVAT